MLKKPMPNYISPDSRNLGGNFELKATLTYLGLHALLFFLLGGAFATSAVASVTNKTYELKINTSFVAILIACTGLVLAEVYLLSNHPHIRLNYFYIGIRMLANTVSIVITLILVLGTVLKLLFANIKVGISADQSSIFYIIIIALIYIWSICFTALDNLTSK